MSIEAQFNVIKNAEELCSFNKGVAQWENEMKLVDEQLRNLPSIFEETADDECVKEGEQKIEDLQRKNDVKKSEKISYNKEKKVVNRRANEHKERGNNFVVLGKWNQAINEYSKAIKLDGDEAAYYGNRSYCYLQLDELEQAEQDCNKALDIDSKYGKVLLRRALIRKKLNRLPGAATDLENLLNIEPLNKTAWKLYEEITPRLKELNYFDKYGILIHDQKDTDEEDDDEKEEDTKHDSKKFNEKQESDKNVKEDSDCLHPLAEFNSIDENKSTDKEETFENTITLTTKEESDENHQLINPTVTNEAKPNSEKINYTVEPNLDNILQDNKLFEEINILRNKPAHKRSKLTLKRIDIED